jgi:2-oxoglutarate ferredoxin oxidoreductase subunit gamma
VIERIIIAGEGGQGVLFLGRVLAEAACSEGKFVTWLPAYGAEVRGGTANCMVVISDQEIGSPFIEEADALIILNEPSMVRFQNRLAKKGLLVVNGSLVPQPSAAGAAMEKHAFTDIAVSLGNAKAANMVALGCFVGRSRILAKESILDAIQAMIAKDKPNLAKLNADAFLNGIDLVQFHASTGGIHHGPR